MSAAPAAHVKARGPHPQYPPRFSVPTGKVAWSVPWPEYSPVDFTHQVVRGQPEWADPPDPRAVSSATWSARVSYEEGGFSRDETSGRPLNPRGRTGMSSRGLLGVWGPNHAADPIVTRYHPTTHQLQMVAIRRKDTGDWAIPGGMVDPGEAVSVTVRREFIEEAGNIQDAAERALFERLIDKLFDSGKVVYRG